MIEQLKSKVIYYSIAILSFTGRAQIPVIFAARWRQPVNSELGSIPQFLIFREKRHLKIIFYSPLLLNSHLALIVCSSYCLATAA